MAPRKRPGRPIGETIGGILVGFDQQLLRNQPPPEELVRKGSPVRGLAGADGTELVVVFPEDDTPPDPTDGAPGQDPRVPGER